MGVLVMASVRRIDADELRASLLTDRELALLDAREALSYGDAHILYASNMPLSRLECLAPVMLARRSVPAVLCDRGGGLAERAAQRLVGFGYADVSVLEGGVDAWAAAGYELFSGVNVPSKAFGEFVEHAEATPSVSAGELHTMMTGEGEVVVLDARPMPEYHHHSIPSGICVPGAELAYRVHDLVASPDIPVVVNCAGRTRSIIGAQSLINAGVPNRVVALRNGTMGWHLAGHALDNGATRTYAAPTEAGLSTAKTAAARVAKRYRVRYIDRAELDRWQRENEQRSLYLLDVRSPEEYEAGHLPGSRSTPGGQLVQETDAYVATLRARIVLADDDGVRATMTASWLTQMGWREVAVLEDALQRHDLEQGPERREVLGLREAVHEDISPEQLRSDLSRAAATVVDLATSRHFKAGHIPGAVFALRARLGESLPGIGGQDDIVLTSQDGRLARLAAAEASAVTDRAVKVLAGGTEAWRRCDYELEAGGETMADDPDDVWLKPYDQVSGVEQAMEDYLTWEVALVEQVERDGTAMWLRDA